MTDLAERLLRDRADHAERERRRLRSLSRQPKPEGAEFDPFGVTRWRVVAGSDPGYLPVRPCARPKLAFGLPATPAARNSKAPD